MSIFNLASCQQIFDSFFGRPWCYGRQPLASLRPAAVSAEHGGRTDRLLHRHLHHSRRRDGHDPRR